VMHQKNLRGLGLVWIHGVLWYPKANNKTGHATLIS